MRNIEDALRMLYGLPPHDAGSNICRDDGYYAQSLEKQYGIEALKKAVKKLGREWN